MYNNAGGVMKVISMNNWNVSYKRCESWRANHDQVENILIDIGGLN